MLGEGVGIAVVEADSAVSNAVAALGEFSPPTDPKRSETSAERTPRVDSIFIRCW